MTPPQPLYIIPARGGSKGIPRKNIRPLCGRPLLAYTVDCAIAACGSIPGYILLSTDDDEIASVARSLGLKVEYMRPSLLGADTTGSREVMLDAMMWADRHNIVYDCIVLLQPTSPLRTADDVRQAIGLYSPAIDMVVSVCPSNANPYYNIFECDGRGYLHISKGDGLYDRRQDCPPVWEYNGAVYVINPESLLQLPMGAFPRRVPYVMPRERSIDLDTPADWNIIEQIMKQ